jgi:hypothetical protein
VGKSFGAGVPTAPQNKNVAISLSVPTLWWRAFLLNVERSVAFCLGLRLPMYCAEIWQVDPANNIVPVLVWAGFGRLAVSLHICGSLGAEVQHAWRPEGPANSNCGVSLLQTPLRNSKRLTRFDNWIRVRSLFGSSRFDQVI